MEQLTAVLSRRTARDTDNLMRAANVAMKLIASRIGSQYMQQLRSGKRVELEAYLRQVLLPVLRSLMLASHLSGIRRLWLTKKQAPIVKQQLAKARLQLSALDDALEVLKLRAGLDVSALEQQYNTEALRIVKGTSDDIDRELQGTLNELLSTGSHVKESVRVLGEKLDSLGLSPLAPHRLEAIFRTQSQLTYGAGKWQAEQDPDIQEILWGYRYSTVGDDRVREEHARLEGITLPKDDPFWKRFYPPNGWNCRCQAIPIFEEVPVNRGILDDPTEEPLQPDTGFDFNPGEVFKAPVLPLLPPPVVPPPQLPAKPVVNVTNPPQVKLPPQVGDVYAAAVKNNKAERDVIVQQVLNLQSPRQIVEAANLRREQIKVEVKALTDKETARATELSKKIVAEQLKENPDAKLIAKYRKEQAKQASEADKEFGRLLKASSNELKRIGNAEDEARNNALAVMRAKQPSQLFTVMTFTDKGVADTVKEAKAFLNQVVDKNAAGNQLIQIVKHADFNSGREYALGDSIYLTKNTPTQTVIHEIGHTIEFADKKARAALEDFSKLRTKTTPDVDLSKLFPTYGYKPGEIGNGDDWEKTVKACGMNNDSMVYYIGKRYSNGQSEVLTVGLEMLYKNPVEFAKNDPEYFSLVLAVLRGDIK